MSRSRGGRWSCSASLTSLANTSSPPSIPLSPASIRSSVVLPEPLRPDSVSRSRRSSLNERPRSRGSPAMSLARSEAITTAIDHEDRYPRSHGPHRAAHALAACPQRSDRARLPGRGSGQRLVCPGQRQGRHQRRLHPDRRLPRAHPAALAPAESARAPQGPSPRRGQGAPRARRPARRLVIHYERRGAAALVTIDRPERHNAIDGAAARGLRAAFDRFTTDDDAAVLVLTGAGEAAFCAGADLKAIETLDPAAPGGPLGFTRLASPKPTVAAICGHCLAGGFELALWCDLRVATTTATFGCAERRWGVPLIDGGTQRLPRIVGTGRALDLILTGRTIDAEEAHALGLITRLTEPGGHVEAALELAEQIAAHPRD